jgi:large subunit ribosomal protein L4e
VTILSTSGDKAGETALPAVFLAPIRRDVVQFVHSNVAKNRRQAYAVAYSAGEQTSAMSWGTGRAVARIPRVGGGGTGRSGQGAFGNMCRKGRMFAPTKIWRRWHRKVNVNQRRYAIASALAATAVPALVQARGHKIDGVKEIPLVVKGLEGISKTREAVAVLEKLGAYADVDRVAASKRLRAGRGKMRNRRFTQRRGPLVIYTEASTQRAFRNIPGVDTVHIDRLNLLQLAPGGHMGRFCVWSDKAFEKLNALFGSLTTKSTLKTGFSLPRASMVNADLARLINSTEIQSVVNPAVRGRRLAWQKKNPLRNFKALVKLNPYAQQVRKTEVAAAEARSKARGAKKAVKRGTRYLKARRAASTAIFNSITNFESYAAPAIKK